MKKLIKKNYLLKLTKVLVFVFGVFFFFSLKLSANVKSDSLARVDVAVKINPLILFRGEIPLYLEKKISPHLSIEGAIALTRKDPFSGVFDFDLDNLSGTVQGESGFGYKAAVRYYFVPSLELDGAYISLEFVQREMKKSYALTDTNGLDLNERIFDTRNFTDLKIVGGIQRLSYYNNFFIDLYGGVGYRIKEFEEVHLNQNADQPSHVLIETEDSNIALFLGFKIGLGF